MAVCEEEAQKRKKERKAPSGAAVAEDEGTVEGTMDGQKFYEWWFVPVVRLFEFVHGASSIDELYKYLKKVVSEAGTHMAKWYTQEYLLADCATLGFYLGRKPCWHTDGASYHKVVD